MIVDNVTLQLYENEGIIEKAKTKEKIIGL